MAQLRNYPFRALVAMLGFGLVIGLVFPFAVDPFVDWAPGGRTGFSLLCVVAGLLVGGVGYLIVHMIVLRRFSAMAAAVMDRAIGRGDLATTIPVESDDAIGRVGEAVNASIGSLRAISRATTGAAADLEGSFDDLRTRTADLLRATGDFRRQAEEIGREVTALDSGMVAIVGGVRQISGHMEENSAAILEQEANIQEIDGQADEVIDVIGETASSVEQLSASIRQVAESAASMSSAAVATLDLVGQMTRGVEQIRAMVGEADRFSGSVVEEAKTGVALVARVIQAIGVVDERERESARTLDELRRASESIGEIVTAMRAIAGQTGLLALNASIIAAQSGEEGRSFAVVANSIRGLSEKAAASTREAGEILEGIREGIGKAFAAAGESRDETARGVNLSAEAGEALEKISTMIRQERERVASIGEVAARQAEHNTLITEAMDRVSTMSGQVAAATSEESRGVVQINGTVDRLRVIAGLVKRALAEQRKTSRQLADATEKTAYLVKGSVEAQAEHAARIGRALGVLEGMRGTGAGGRESAAAIERDLAAAARALQELKESVARFHG